MRRCIAQEKYEQGWTLVETMIVVAVIAVIASMAVPTYTNWLPGNRLKAAGRDVFSTMQKARMLAIKKNQPVDVVFDMSATPHSYFIDTDRDGVWDAGEERYVLADYQSGVDFASPAPNCITSNVGWATNPNTPATKITWNPNGTANNSAVYLENKNKDICYGVSVYISGLVKLRKFDGSRWM